MEWLIVGFYPEKKSLPAGNGTGSFFIIRGRVLMDREALLQILSFCPGPDIPRFRLPPAGAVHRGNPLGFCRACPSGNFNK